MNIYTRIFIFLKSTTFKYSFALATKFLSCLTYIQKITEKLKRKILNFFDFSKLTLLNLK